MLSNNWEQFYGLCLVVGIQYVSAHSVRSMAHSYAKHYHLPRGPGSVCSWYLVGAGLQWYLPLRDSTSVL